MQVLDNVQISKLSNGTMLLTEQLPYVQSFSLGFWFTNGSRDESRKNNGISHLLEHMLFKGTERRSAKRISDMIESYGGYLNAFTTKEMTCFYSRGLVRNLNRTFDVLADMVTNPAFRAKDIKTEIGVVLDELNDVNDNPDELIFDKFEEVLYKGNTLSYPVLGHPRNIIAFDEGVMRDYFTSHYTPGNMLISCSGNIEHSVLVVLAEKYFSELGKGKIRRRKNVKKETPRDEVIIKDIEQVHCIIGRQSYGYNDDRRVYLNVLSAIIGDGSSSRLFQAVREKLGITYQIQSFVNSYMDVSSMGIYYSTKGEQVEKVLKIIKKEFSKLQNQKVSVHELKRAKEYIKGSIILGLENTTNRMVRMASSMLRYGKIVTIGELIEKIDTITPEDILTTAQDVLDEDQFSKVFITSSENAKRIVG